MVNLPPQPPREDPPPRPSRGPRLYLDVLRDLIREHRAIQTAERIRAIENQIAEDADQQPTAQEPPAKTDDNNDKEELPSPDR